MDQGWCYSTLDLHIGCASSATDCWNQCEAALGDDLVAVVETSRAISVELNSVLRSATRSGSAYGMRDGGP